MKHTPGPWFWNSNHQLVSETKLLDAWDEEWENIRIVETDGGFYPPKGADRPLIAAAPDLLACLTMGAQVDTPAFLEWVADRFVNMCGENPNVDFVLSLRERAKAMRNAIEKAEGK